MIGGIIGDIVGSRYEDGNIKSKDFPLWGESCHFTDDTVLTVATADCILKDGKFEDYYFFYANQYPLCGYGTGFMKWYFIRKFKKQFVPYQSFGNGSAMRVGPVGWSCKSIKDVLNKSRESAICTHNHDEGIRGAQAIASCVFLARTNKPKGHLKKFVEEKFSYDLSCSLEDIQKCSIWNATSMQTVPQAITAFLESDNYEDCVRNAIAIGGDSDTLACMAGSIAEAYYGVPSELREKAYTYLPEKIIEVIEKFEFRFGK